MIERYLMTPYADGGRGPDSFDCYGLVRMARTEMFGLPLLPSYGAVSVSDKRCMTRIASAESASLSRRPPEPGAIAVCWQRGLCLHVGIAVELDGRLGVLEAHHTRGIGWRSIRSFEREYQRVEYFT